MTFELPLDVIEAAASILLNLYAELVPSKNTVGLLLVSGLRILLFEKISKVMVLRIYVGAPAFLV